MWGTWRRLVYQGLWELDEGALGIQHLSLQRLRGGVLGSSSFTVDPGRYAKKVSGYGHLSPWGPLSTRGEPGMWKGALVVGHLSARDSMKGAWGRAPLLGNPKNEVFERYAKCPVNRPPSL